MLPHEYEAMHALETRHWWFRGRRRVLLDSLRAVARTRAAATPRILDYGCGTGGNTSAYAPLGEVVGIEPDRGAVALAGARGGARFCRASGTQLPFRPAVFDAVVASDVLEHIEDDRAAVAEVVRVLKRGGSFIFSVPAHPWLFSEHDAALLHFRRYTRPALRCLLEGGGLEIRRLSYWNAALFPMVCLHRLVGRKRSEGQARSDTRATPWLVNESLARLLAVEATILRHASLPWGVSLVGIAQRR
jgi:SAM-dependent methyltransferase